MSAAARPAVTVVINRLDPVQGMERAALRLVDALRSTSGLGRVEIVCLRGPSPVAALTGSAANRWMARRDDRSGLHRTIVVGAWAAAAFAASPRRLGHHVVWEHSVLPARLAEDRKLRAISVAARSVWRHADAVVGVSNGVAACVEALAHRPVHVIPNFVPESPPSIPRIARDQEAMRLLSIGALREFKGHDLLLDVLEFDLPHARATILGTGPTGEALRRRVEGSTLRGRVELPGHVSDVRPYLHHATALVHLSRYESFGLAALEAAAAGVPVVAADVDCLGEFVPDLVPGVLVARERAAVAAGIHRAIAAASPTQFEEARIRRTERFDPARTTAAWIEVLRKDRRAVR